MLLGLRFIERNRVAERLDHIYSPPVLDIAIATLVYGSGVWFCCGLSRKRKSQTAWHTRGFQIV